MDIGERVKEVEIPRLRPAQPPAEAPAKPERLPLPANWPRRVRAEPPQLPTVKVR
jgi:hypothetical protein